MNSSLNKTLTFLIFGSLMILAIGLVTSITVLSLYHILILIPALYFLPKANYKTIPTSAWPLMAMIICIILSIVVNQDIAIKGYKTILKAKYFLFGFISVAPFMWYFKNYLNDKKISCLLYSFCIATTIATVSGLIGYITGFNPLLFKEIQVLRNSGLFGMIMNYAHNMSYFLIIITGLFIYREETKKYINIKFLIGVLIVNFVGLYFSYTRGAWLAVLAGIPFFYFKNHKKIFLGICFGLVLLGAAAYFLAGDKVVRPQSERERISQWMAATYAFKERPILGYGYLNFEPHSGEIKERYNLGSVNFVSHAHNNFLEMLGGTGILGFMAFVTWLFFWFKESLAKNSVIAKISVPFIIVFIVGGLTQSTISLGINLFFVMAAWSVSTAFEWSKK